MVGFYKNNATCRPGGVALNPRTTDTETLRSCLETDLTHAQQLQLEDHLVPFTQQPLQLPEHLGGKGSQRARRQRPAADRNRAYARRPSTVHFGAFGWLTGPSPFWKAADQHVINDRMLVDVMWAHLGNNFALDFQEPALHDVQPRFETTTGLWGRSFNASSFMRPTNSLDVVSSYFLPATLGGDHSFKFGYRWRSAHSTSLNHRGGFIEARFTNGIANSADIWRDQQSDVAPRHARVLHPGHLHA